LISRIRRTGGNPRGKVKTGAPYSTYSLPEEVGDDFINPVGRITPILDTDAFRYMYNNNPMAYNEYNQMMANTVGITQNSDGTKRIHDPRLDHINVKIANGENIKPNSETIMSKIGRANINNKIIHDEMKQNQNAVLIENMTQDEKLFTSDPLTLLDIGKINLVSGGRNTRINSLAKICLIGSGVYMAKSGMLKSHGGRYLIIILIALVLLKVLSSNNKFENYAVVPYEPMDKFHSEQLRLRTFDPYKWSTKFSPHSLMDSIIRY